MISDGEDALCQEWRRNCMDKQRKDKRLKSTAERRSEMERHGGAERRDGDARRSKAFYANAQTGYEQLWNCTELKWAAG